MNRRQKGWFVTAYFDCIICIGFLFKPGICLNRAPSGRTKERKHFESPSRTLGGQDYVPQNYHERTPNRVWMANLCKGCAVGLIANSIDTLGFQEFISSVLKQRSSRILEKQGFSMDVDSNVARILTSSKFVAGKLDVVNTNR